MLSKKKFNVFYENKLRNYGTVKLKNQILIIEIPSVLNKINFQVTDYPISFCYHCTIFTMRLYLPMKYLFHILISLFCLYGLHGQSKIDQALRKFNNNSVPYITAESLTGNTRFLLLDTREKEEFEVSHLENAVWVGNKISDLDRTYNIVQEKNTPIVLYCSIGIRSEDIGEKLIKNGFTEVYNLYGGIFEWKNKGLPVYDSIGQKTDRIHAYSKHWGKMLNNATKVYGHRKHNN